MKKIKMFTCIIAIGIMLSVFCSGCTNIEPGWAGLKINRVGADKGVEDIPVVTGLIFYLPFVTQIKEYPVYVQSYVYTASHNEGKKIDESVTFNDLDQLSINADINVSYIIQLPKLAGFYVKFRSDDIDEFTHGYLRNTLRDSLQLVASTMKYEDLNGKEKSNFINAVKNMMNEDLNRYGCAIEQLGFVGSLRPPKEIDDAIKSKMKAIQDSEKAKNKVVQATAEANQAIETARGQAEANKLLSDSLTPSLIKWQELTITKAAVEKWNGARPMVEGSTSGLLLNITPPK